MDGVVSPKLAIEMGRLGGLAVLNLEGIFSRYENPDEVLDRITSASLEEATKIIQGIYGEPIKEELIHKRISEIKKGGGPVMVSAIPQRAERFAKIAEEAGADFFVVQSTVTTARHVASEYTPMDLRELKKHLSIPLDRRQYRDLRGLSRADGVRCRRHAHRRRARAPRARAARCSGSVFPR